MKKKVLIIISILIIVPSILIIFMNFQAKLQDGLKSYIRAEGLYSKGQKNSVYYLSRYIINQNETDYINFLTQIKIPLGVKKARLALQNPDIDIKEAYEGFSEGKNTSQDIKNMIWLFDYFKNIDFFKDATIIWEKGDNLNTKIKLIGEDIHNIISNNKNLTQKQKDILNNYSNELFLLNEELEKFETRFSTILSNISIDFKNYLQIAGFSIFALLLIISLLLARRILNEINESQEKLSNYKNNLENLVEEKTVKIIESEKFLSNIIESSLDGIVTINDKGIIETFNKAASDLFGYTKVEAIGQNVNILVPSPHHEKHDEYIENYMRTGIAKAIGRTAELYAQRKDGSKFLASLRIGKIDLESKTIFTALIQDITEIKKAQKELEKAKEKALDATKTKSSFLANMSHEIRTPMTGIIGMSKLALETELTKKQENYLKKINLSANNLLEIINDILDISKIEAGKLEIVKEDFDLFEVIQNVINMVEINAMEKNLDINVDYDHSLGRSYYGDALRINQILMNLIGNAIKFTHQGEVKLKVFKVDKNHLRFEIIDSGIGIPKEVQDKLFDSFEQADSSTTKKYGGTGLGLSICKQLVEMMNGKIWCESEENIGSKFIFEIELEKIDKKSTIKTNINLEKSLEGIYVLLAEDNLVNQEVITEILTSKGIKIDIANNGLEAVEKFKANQDDYDAILMDIQMPILDGYEATKQIRKLNIDIPIIALTANAMKEDIEKTKAVGMNAHLNKPIDFKKLLETINKFSNIHETIEEKEVEKSNISSQIPEFKYLDVDYGLNLVMGIEPAYLELVKGLLKYKTMDFNSLNDEELKRTAHSLKGLSASAGASELSESSLDLEKTLDRSKIDGLKEKLNIICEDIEEKLNIK